MSWQRTKCIIPCCQASVKLFPERKFFRFPKPGTDKYDKWLAVLCDLSDIIKKRKCAYICDIHFEESSIGVKYLKSCAVPSLNLDEASFSALPPRLPTKPQIQEDWFRAILDETSQTVFSEDDLICSKHFSPDSFTTSNDGEQILKPSAIPFESLKKPGPELKRLKREKSTTSEIQCSVFSCEHSLSTTSTLRPQLIYHPFPSNEDLIEKWKQFCNKEDNDFAKSYICSDHFTDDDFVSKRGSGRAKTLKSQAIPSIYKREVATEEQSELESSNVSVDATYEPEVDGSTSNPSGDFETDETANYGGKGKALKSDSIGKRVRNRPYKKWMEKEVLNLLEYLIEYQDIEKPSARIYYKKFLEKNQIDVTWDLVKWKVRNLRTVYNKTKHWQNSAGAEVLKVTNESYVKDIVKRMCPHFEKLDEIFSENTNKTPKVYEDDIMETDESVIGQPPLLRTNLNSESTQDTTFTNSKEVDTPDISIPNSSVTNQNKETKDFETGVQLMPSLKVDKIDYKKIKMEFAKEKFEKIFALKEMKFQFEKEKTLKELELKAKALELQKMGIEQEERLKKFEIKKNERIAMKELELKYKHLPNTSKNLNVIARNKN